MLPGNVHKCHRTTAFRRVVFGVCILLFVCKNMKMMFEFLIPRFGIELWNT
jgi:hypothetical protein